MAKNSNLEDKISKELEKVKEPAKRGDVTNVKLGIESIEKDIQRSENYEKHQEEIREIKITCYENAIENAKNYLIDGTDPSLLLLAKKDIIKYIKKLDLLTSMAFSMTRYNK